ncbi:MAG TPA: S41 family peptidase [Longimicrobium sp.]|nr:S41 family peptidase [Longimicrobium sp.]
MSFDAFSTFAATARQAALSVGAAALCGAASVSAQAPAAPPPLTAQVRAEVVDSLAAAMVRFYAVADTGALIAAHLQGRLRGGAYDGIAQPARFADALTLDLRAINGDRHLSVAASGADRGAVPMGRTSLPPLNDTPPGYDGTLGPRTSSLPLSPEEARSPALLAARRSNYQMPRVEVLPGNVGYVEFRGFPGGAEPMERMVDALRFVEHADALILDVRDHRGGSPFMTTLLTSHFFGPDTVHLVDVAVRAANQRSQIWTLPRVPGPRRPDVPLYVLTSRGTISAGEALAFALKNTRRGTVVGERTHGAGRNNPGFDVGHGFTASISVSVVTDPRTGAQFEGHGVQPDVAVPPRDALAVAHELALKQLAEREEAPARKRELALTAEVVAVQRAARVVPVETLQRYAGTYEGGRTITVENGTLVWRRLPEHLGQEMGAISDTVFAPASLPAMRITFEPDGPGFRLRQVLPSGQSLTFARTGPPADLASEYR